MCNESTVSSEHNPLPIATIRGHKSNIWRVAYPHNGQIVTAASDRTTKIWHMENSKQPGAAMKHENGLSTLAVNRDGKKKIISGGVDGPVKLWDVASHKHVVTCALLSQRKKKLACTTEDNSIVVFDVATGELVLGPLTAQKGWVHSVVWSRDGDQFFPAVDDCTICHWNCETSDAAMATISPDGSRLMCGPNNHAVRFWDMNSGCAIAPALHHG
ncbi:WD40-repeat-containing domain protein [Tylopilus felleus]